MEKLVSPILTPKSPGRFSRLFARLFRKYRATVSSTSQQIPLSIQPNAAYFIEVNESPYRKLIELIEVSDGGVFAVTGVRGVGKSVLLNSIASHFQNRFHTLSLAAPIGSAHEMDFFMALFRLLCDSVRTKLRKTVFKEAFDLKAIGGREARRQLYIFLAIAFALQLFLGQSYLYQQAMVFQRHIAREVRSTDFRMQLVQESLESLLGGSSTTPYVSSKPSKGKTSGANEAEPLTNELDNIKASRKELKGVQDKLNNDVWTYNENDVRDAVTVLDASTALLGSIKHPHERPDRGFYQVQDVPSATSSSTWLLATSVISLLVGMVAWWAWRFLLRYNRFRRNPAALGLLITSADISEYLDFEMTRSREAEINIPFFKDLSGKFKKSSELKTRSPSLSSLTSQYIAYVQQLLEVIPDKLVVCIDELDKITDLDSVRSILREIKGGLYVKGCFYIISLSEDVLQAFGSRLSSSRDIFESTFDEVFNIVRLNMASCELLLTKRLQATSSDKELFGESGHKIILLCSVLSSGIPRDLIRNFRECVLLVGSDTKPSVVQCWMRLFLRKVEELKGEVLIHQGCDDVRALLLEELDFLLTDHILPNVDLSRTVARLQKMIATLKSEVKDAKSRIKNQIDDQEIVALKNWIRDWIELEIFAFAAQSVLIDSIENANILEELRSAYSLLPYSAERCQSRLQSLFPDHLCSGALGESSDSARD